MKHLSIFVMLLTVVMTSCRTDQDVAKARKEGYEEGKSVGYREGYSVGVKKAETSWIEKGKKLGEADGFSKGKIEGEKVGFDKGLVLGKKEGEKEGYKKGTLSFVKNSLIPTAGTVVVFLLGLLLFGLLRALFKSYFNHLKSSYQLKLNKANLISDIVRRKSNQFNVKDGFHEITIEGLEKAQKSLNEARLSLLQDEINNANARGHIESANKLILHKDSLLRAEELIKSVSDNVLMDNIVAREKLILNVIRGVMKDKSIPVKTKNYILENLNN